MAAVVLRSLRRAAIVCGALNSAVAALGGVIWALLFRGCGAREKVPLMLATASAALKVVAMVGSGIAQGLTASTIAGHAVGGDVNEDGEFRRQRKRRYKRWLWWRRFGMAITSLQIVGATYLVTVIAKDFSHTVKSECFLGQDTDGGGWKKTFLIFFLVMDWLVVIIQCCVGSEVLRWRSFYATHDAAWKTYYREVFDHGIREALCCLGRQKYLNVLEEDEVYIAAGLLGDLMAYRASGTGHIELIAGLALLQRRKQSPNLNIELMEAPESCLREAVSLHKFAEAAYTGPLLDFGRNLVLFPCAWLYRQGMLTPWTRNRHPQIEGDNWWRGHAAAFLKFANLSPQALRKGRVSQTNRGAAYFVVVLHDLKSVLIAVRGTETPEDLLTDSLGRKCLLSEEDLDGLINSDRLPPRVRQSVMSSFPHYGHHGIVESARELFMQIDGQPGNKENSPLENSGFLSSLMGVGGECHGYKVQIVGHSLGGSVATLLGLQLYRRYPGLHVYAYGSLPCVDSIVAEACSNFVTTIVYNDEYAARLSVNSILRLRAAAIAALTDKCSDDSTMMSEIVQRTSNANENNQNGDNHRITETCLQPCTLTGENSKHIYIENSKCVHIRRSLENTVNGGAFLCSHAISCVMNMPTHLPCSHVMEDYELSLRNISESRSFSDREAYIGPNETAAPDKGLCQKMSWVDDLDLDILEDGIIEHRNSELPTDIFCECSVIYNKTCLNSSSDFMTYRDQTSQSVVNPSLSTEVTAGQTAEMYLPGLIIHIVLEQRCSLPPRRCWRTYGKEHNYKAFVANRESFKDITVTPHMFLDHLPWRCRYAMQRALETRISRGQVSAASLNGEQIV